MSHELRTMQEAFAALLSGDTDKRDRLLEGIEQARLMDAKERALAKLKAVDFFVRSDGSAIASADIRRVAQ